jgi:hypothetical protein
MSKIYLITETASHTTGHGSSDESTELCRLNLYGPFAPAFKTRAEAQAYIDRDQARGIGKSKLWNPGITELKVS